jgi:microcystin-dependent protein
MATVTGFTSTRMLAMENATVISGTISGNNLMLTTKGGTQINAGNVRGPTGASGPPGSGYIVCTSTTRPALILADEGKAIYETDTDLIRTWTGTRWKLQERIVCTSTTRPAGVVAADEGVVIYETDTDLLRTWTGTRWKLQEMVVCTSITRPAMAAADEGVKIYETDTDSEFIWTGSSWISALSSVLPVGFEMIWPGQLGSIPSGFLHENGAVLVRATYPALFNVLQTSWNTGGETASQFRLPDSRDKVVVGAGGAFVLGGYGGESAHTLTTGEMPSHTHTQSPHSHGPSDLIRQSGSGGGLGLTAPGSLGNTANATATNQNTGGGAAHNNMQPYAAKYVIIRAL